MLQEVTSVMRWEQGSYLKRLRDSGQCNWKGRWPRRGRSQLQEREPDLLLPNQAVVTVSREWHSWTRGRALVDTPSTPPRGHTDPWEPRYSLIPFGYRDMNPLLCSGSVTDHQTQSLKGVLHVKWTHLYSWRKTKSFLGLIRIFCLTQAKIFIWTVGFLKKFCFKRKPC